MMKSIKYIAILSAVFVTGCMVGPNYKEPQVRQVPAEYGQEATAATQPATPTSITVRVPASREVGNNDGK
jgi:hypothetical protein